VVKNRKRHPKRTVERSNEEERDIIDETRRNKETGRRKR
jgi:hypothetical protein